MDKPTSNDQRLYGLSYPGFNHRSKWTKYEQEIVMDEIPYELLTNDRIIDEEFDFFNGKCDERNNKIREIRKLDADRYKMYFEYFCQRSSRIEHFGHLEFIKGFVRPGQLTTRYEVSIGLFAIVWKNLCLPLNKISLQDQKTAIMASFDIIKMPDINFEEEIGKVMRRFRYDKQKHDIYMKQIYSHLTPQLTILFDLNKSFSSPNPSIKMTKPYLRIFRIGDLSESVRGDDFVFVDEVKLIINRLRKRKNVGMDATSYHPYFPIEYLNFALELFGFHRDNIELVIVWVREREPNNYCFIQSPAGDNVVPAETCFFRFMLALSQAKATEKQLELLSSYQALLGTKKCLPYFIKYFRQMEKDRSSDYAPITMKNYVKTMKTFSKYKENTLEVKKETRNPVVDWEKKSSGENIKNIPFEAMQKLPKSCRNYAMKFLMAHPNYALLLHEQGFCEPDFCYAKVLRVNSTGFPCQKNSETMKKIIDFFLKKDYKNKTTLERFYYSMEPDFVQFWKPEERSEEPETSDSSSKHSRRSSQEVASLGDGVTSAQLEELEKGRNLSCSSSGFSSTSTDVHPDGTEKSWDETTEDEEVGEINDEEKPAENQYDETELLRDDKAQYEKMIKTIEQEHESEIEKLNKKIKQETKKAEADRLTIEKQRAEIKEWKKKFEASTNEKNGLQTKLDGDIKRISAEKKKIEDDFEKLKTQKAIENPNTLTIEKIKLEEKIKKQEQEHKKSLSSQTKELENVSQELEEQKRENLKLKETNQELIQGVSLNKEVVSLQIRNRELEHQFELTQLKLDHKIDRVTHIENQFSRMEKQLQTQYNQLKGMEYLKKKLTQTVEIKEVLEKNASASCQAAIRRMEELHKLLEKSKKDEHRFTTAFRRLKAYEIVEDQWYYEAKYEAKVHYEKARIAKNEYENNLLAGIEQIKVNVPRYFTLKDTLVNPTMYPNPISEKAEERMLQLRAKIDQQLQDDQWKNYRTPRN